MDPFVLICRPPQHRESQNETFTESLQVVAHDPLAEVSERERPVPGLIAEGRSNQAIAVPESADQNPNG